MPWQPRSLSLRTLTTCLTNAYFRAPANPGLGVTNVCSLEEAAPSDALLSVLHGAAQGMGSSGTPCGPSTLAIGVTRQGRAVEGLG